MLKQQSKQMYSITQIQDKNNRTDCMHVFVLYNAYALTYRSENVCVSEYILYILYVGVNGNWTGFI